MRRLVQPRDYASLILAESLGRIFGRTIGRRYLIAPAEDAGRRRASRSGTGWPGEHHL
jgi:hypothetical protein